MCCNNTVSNAWGCGCTGSTPTTTATTMPTGFEGALVYQEAERCTARVLEVRCDSLLVCDCSTCQQVQVNTANACCYQVGDCLCIHYNGAMTNSIPPQISATCIHRR